MTSKNPLHGSLAIKLPSINRLSQPEIKVFTELWHQLPCKGFCQMYQEGASPSFPSSLCAESGAACRERCAEDNGDKWRLNAAATLRSCCSSKSREIRGELVFYASRNMLPVKTLSALSNHPLATSLAFSILEPLTAGKQVHQMSP